MKAKFDISKKCIFIPDEYFLLKVKDILIKYNQKISEGSFIFLKPMESYVYFNSEYNHWMATAIPSEIISLKELIKYLEN